MQQVLTVISQGQVIAHVIFTHTHNTNHAMKDTAHYYTKVKLFLPKAVSIQREQKL
jgi:hypothetical protein